MTTWLLALFLAPTLFAGASIVVSTLRLGISPMPSSRVQTRAVLEAVASATSTDFAGTLHELGSGWGTLAFALAARFPRAEVVAFEASLLPWLFSRLRLWFQPRPHLAFRRQDFFTADWSRAEVFVTYLYPAAMQRLVEALPGRASPDSLLVTHTFAARGLLQCSETRLSDLWRTPVAVYRCRSTGTA